MMTTEVAVAGLIEAIPYELAISSLVLLVLVVFQAISWTTSALRPELKKAEID